MLLYLCVLHTVTVQNALERNYFNTADHWDKLGLKLGLLHPTLKAIRATNNNDPTRCLTDMLAHWLRGTDGVTWNILGLALKGMGYTAAYESIEEGNRAEDLMIVYTYCR